CMFCTDDLHPDNLVHGHINRLVTRAVGEGHDLFAVLRAATLNPVRHYGLRLGLLQPGDPADFIVVDGLRDFRVRQTYIDGELVAADGRSLIDRVTVPALNRWGATAKRVEQFHVPARGGRVRAIEVFDGQLMTNELHLAAREDHSRLVAD